MINYALQWFSSTAAYDSIKMFYVTTIKKAYL